MFSIRHLSMFVKMIGGVEKESTQFHYNGAYFSEFSNNFTFLFNKVYSKRFPRCHNNRYPGQIF